MRCMSREEVSRSAELFCETAIEKTTLFRKTFTWMYSTSINVNVNIVHLYSAICVVSEALLDNHLYSVPSQGQLWQCFEHDTLRLLHYSHMQGCNSIDQPAQSNNTLSKIIILIINQIILKVMLSTKKLKICKPFFIISIKISLTQGYHKENAHSMSF